MEELEITAADKDGKIEVEAVDIKDEEEADKIIAIELKLKPGKKDITIKLEQDNIS